MKEVTVKREDIRLCDRCQSPLVGGFMGINNFQNLQLNEQSVRTLAGMEIHFGSGNELLASIMSPSITATELINIKRVLCSQCCVGLMMYLNGE